MLRLFIAFCFGILFCIGGALFVLWIGAINMAAAPPPGPIESFVGNVAYEGSLARRAPHTTDPYKNDPAVIQDGFAHFHENCVMCHGAPDVKPAELAKGLHPDAPELSADDTQAMSDGELFWTVKNGVRMTGMPAFSPTHTDDEIWKIIAFMRHLNHLTPEEKAQLRAATGEGDHHHEADEAGAHEH